MAAARNPLEVYRLLPQTNCADCGVRTCMAFAAALARGERRVAGCPHVDPGAAERIADYLGVRTPAWHGQAEEVERLRAAVAALDLGKAAARLGADLAGGRLRVKSLGKDFLVGPDGSLASDCHTHPGLAIPLLRYVLHSRGDEPSGRWVPFRELAGAAGRAPLFEQMCEKPLRGLVDANTELLRDLIDLFAGERSTNLFGSDVSLVLFPLPRIPVLICYWAADEGMASSLHVFFDGTADRHLTADWIHGLCVGLVEMFARIARKHS